MAEPRGEEEERRGKEEKAAMLISRKDKRKERKRMKRKQARREMAEKEREEEERRQNDPEEQRRVREMEEEERQRMERERLEFEERERLWMEAMERKRKEEEKEAEEEEQRRKILENDEEEAKRLQDQVERETERDEEDDDDDWEYAEEGPPEIIWQGNEIIFRKKKVRVPKKKVDKQTLKENVDRPTSNPLPPQSEAFVEYQNASGVSAQQMLENVSQQVPNFGTEQDKAHCPFHFKTGACRFGLRCSRVHFYPDKACTLLIKNMYSGPGLFWEQDEGLEFFGHYLGMTKCLSNDCCCTSEFCLEDSHDYLYVNAIENFYLTEKYTDEEVERCYEEFYEDVHTEFLKYGEIINFKTCRNGLFHLRGNVYVHYKSLDSAVLAFQSFNGRYFAGRQVKCEFVNVTRWKVAICGEFMKTRLKTCSRGMACNFLHCFRNPGGDYEWADWDKPPPKYWVRKMASLFGYSDESAHEKPMEQEKLGQMRAFGKTTRANTVRHHARRSRSREVDHLTFGDYESDSEEGINWQSGTNNIRKEAKIYSKHPGEENRNLKRYRHRDRRSHESEYDGAHPGRDIDRERENDRHCHHSRKRSKHHGEVSECSTGYQITESWIEKIYSDEEWLDGGRNIDRHQHHTQSFNNQTRAALDSKSLPYESDAYHLERDKDGEQHSSRRERGPRCQREVQSPDSGYSGEWQLYGERDKDSHRHHRSKSLLHQKSVLESPDDHWDDRYRGHDLDYRDDWLDRDRGRDHSCTRKRSRDSEPWSSDDELSPNRLKEKSHGEKSESGRSLLGRNPTVCHSRRRNHSSRESGEAELQEFSEVDKYYVGRESIDPGSRWKTVDQDHWELGSSPSQ